MRQVQFGGLVIYRTLFIDQEATLQGRPEKPTTFPVLLVHRLTLTPLIHGVDNIGQVPSTSAIEQLLSLKCSNGRNSPTAQSSLEFKQFGIWRAEVHSLSTTIYHRKMGGKPIHSKDNIETIHFYLYQVCIKIEFPDFDGYVLKPSHRFIDVSSWSDSNERTTKSSPLTLELVTT